jgi:pimeloyl-ACP methyl ester carboxylesterase
VLSDEVEFMSSRRLERLVRALPAVLLLVASTASLSRADGPAGVRIVVPGSVQASEDFQWHASLRVINDLEVGVFGDSLECTVEDLDPGITGSGRLFKGASTPVTSVMKSLGQRDSTTIPFSAIASSERARLAFRLFTHAADGTRYESLTSCETKPGLISRSFPSIFLTEGKGRIETILVPEHLPRGPSPGILLVHPEGSHARRMLPIAWNLADAGYTVMLVSLPGYGQSSGPADFAGPASVRALTRALDALRRDGQVDSTRLAVWGISRGASAAALLAAQRRDLAAAVLQSGVFDPARAYRATHSDSLRRALDHEGKTEGGWSRRSAFRVADRLTMPVLFIHGDQDSVAIANQSVDLAGKLRAAGRDARLELVPGVGHAVPSAVSYPLVLTFLKPILKPAR